MAEKLFVHMNFGPNASYGLSGRLNNVNVDVNVNVNIDGQVVYNLKKSDFIPISVGTHSISFMFDYQWGTAPLYVNVWGGEYTVKEGEDLHFTINVFFANDKGVQFFEGDVECDPLQEKSMRSGCYVATAVYGSYDCPEVWVLRRFRDDSLGKTRPGRAFIKAYYAISPTLVKWFGNSKLFKKICKAPLDSLVKKLEKKGVANTAYYDKDWSDKK